MPSPGRVDLGAYVRAAGLLVRNPQIALAPLLCSVVVVLLSMLLPGIGGGLFDWVSSGIGSLISQLIFSFGLAVALIVSETAWRRGRAPFDEAWDDARRKAGGILMAALGFNFVLYVAGVLGAFLSGYVSLILTLVATFFFIYTIPAASIGGFPGGAALNASLERARRAPLATVLVTALFLFSLYAPTLVLDGLVLAVPGSALLESNVALRLISAGVQAVVTGYFALVLAKAYDDASYGRFY